MLKNIFSRVIRSNLSTSWFANEYTCYRSKLFQFSKNLKPKISHQLFTSFFFSKTYLKYPIILYSSFLATIPVVYKIQNPDESEENQKLQYAINKGIWFLQQDKFDKAEKQLYEALHLAQEQNNLDALLIIYTSLAEAVVNKKEYMKGEQILINAKEVIMKNGIPFDDVKVMNILINLGITYEAMQNFKKAKESYEFAYEVLEKKVNGQKENEIETIMLWNSLLNVYGNFLITQSNQAAGDEKSELLNAGLSHLVKALDVWIEKNGRESEEVALMCNELAIKFLSAGDVDNAIKYLNEAIQVGENVPKTTVLPLAYTNLGMVYLGKGMFEESKTACEESLKIAKKHSDNRAKNDANTCLREINRVMKALNAL